MIGSNDFCLDVCYYNNQDKLVEKARADMIRVLRILRENLPRTLVNVVVPVGKETRFCIQISFCEYEMMFVALQMSVSFSS